MYQWRESRREEDERVHYDYDMVWSESPIDSYNFDDKSKVNPANTWPFQTQNQEASCVTLGKYRLSSAQVSRLGRTRTKTVDLTEGGDVAVSQTEGAMGDHGFAAFEVRGNYLYSSAMEPANHQPHIGQYRVKFEYEECGPTTIIAQQIVDPNDEGSNTTFRKWNPDKPNVPFGESTDAIADDLNRNVLCCYICMCVDCCLNVAFEEVVDCA